MALPAIRTTEVGVAMASEMRRRRTSSEKVTMSSPLPVIELMTPPTAPKAMRSTAWRGRKRWMWSWTSRSR